MNALRDVLGSFAVLLGLSAVACARAAPTTAERDTYTAAVQAPPATMSAGSPERLPAGAQPQAPVPPAGLEAMSAARKLIRTGQLSLEVASYEKAAEAVAQLAEAHGGYLADTQSGRGEGGRRHGTLTLRVAAPRFAAALAAVKALGKLESERIATQDVTKAYSDLETRLRVKRDTAERLRQILTTRTAKLAEVLEAERELARVTEEIEQMEGERRFYDQQVALSTITAGIHEPEAVVRPGLFTPVKQALRDSLSVLATSVAGLIYVLVFVLPWVIVLALAWNAVRAIRARRRPVA